VLTAAVASWLALAAPCRAQGIYGGEFERAMRPGAYVPYDGMPFSHRYGYEIGPVFYLNGNASRYTYLEYLDRLDRAERFGYRIPDPPVYRPQRVFVWWK
jgi:hypothetical protein